MLSTLPNLCRLIHFDLRTLTGSQSEFTNHWKQIVRTEEESNLKLTTLTDAIRLTSAKLALPSTPNRPITLIDIRMGISFRSVKI